MAKKRRESSRKREDRTSENLANIQQNTAGKAEKPE